MPCSHVTAGFLPPQLITRFGCTRRGGFSLMELAISLLIISLITGFGLQIWAHTDQTTCTRSTPDEMAAMQNAIDQFVASNGRYPLPASRHIGVNDPGYGREASGPFDSAIVRIPQASPVLVGALPHVTLNLPADLASDCWGHKFTYAITQNFTTTAGYGNGSNFGGVILRYGTLASAQELDSDAAYAIVSHGPDALGASRANYSGPEINCNTVATDLAQPRIDKENCDTINSIYYLSEINTEAADHYFDDYVVVANRVLSPNDCAASTITWGGNCSGSAILTLAGLSVNVTNTAPGYTGLALSTCHNGVRTTLGVCLPIGACVITSPRDGNPAAMLTGTTINYGTGICKTYKCCSGGATISTLTPCTLPLDLPGLGICP